jgi:hypothetical protein
MIIICVSATDVQKKDKINPLMKLFRTNVQDTNAVFILTRRRVIATNTHPDITPAASSMSTLPTELSDREFCFSAHITARI